MLDSEIHPQKVGLLSALMDDEACAARANALYHRVPITLG